MSLLREYIRALVEATEYDSKFKPLMDSGYAGIKQAIELADQLGIPSQELPWELKYVDEFLDQTFDPTLDDLEATGWSLEEYRAAGQKEYEDYERNVGVRESADYGNGDSMSDEEKIVMLFFRESSRMGIQMAEMTPGLEKLAEDLDNFRDQVDGFVDKAEGLVSQGKQPLSTNPLKTLLDQIEYGAENLARRVTPDGVIPDDDDQVPLAMSKWSDELFLLYDGIIIAIQPNSVRWNDKMQTKLDDLKDWARA